MDTDTIPSQDERNFAMLAHLLQLFGGFIAPLVIYLVKRDSRFVSFHAIQALIWQVIYFAFAMLSMIVWFAIMFGSIITHHSSSGSNQVPLGFFIAFPLIWLTFMSGWVVGLILAVVYSIKAYAGQWAEYPVIGRWARRMH